MSNQLTRLTGMPNTPLGFLMHQADSQRRQAGRYLDAMGFGPHETPWRAVARTPGLVLRSYQDPTAQDPTADRGRKAETGGPDAEAPMVLLVPAPIKRPYIWDLGPQYSVVRQLLRAGARVYLSDWQLPEDSHQVLGLKDYADRLLDQCLDWIVELEGDQQPFLMGHSLGGTQAAIYCTLHPRRVAGLVLLEAPLEFGKDGGALQSMIRQSPPTDFLGTLVGNMPGVMMNAFSAIAAPDSYLNQRLRDAWLSMADPDALNLHMRVVRWTLDEMALPRRLFEEVSEDLYRRNLLYRGQLRVNGRIAQPRAMDKPLLAVLDPGSMVIPPGSMLRFLDVTGSRQRDVLEYGGDRGVALEHVGILVGRNAHDRVWPDILRWIRRNRMN